MILAVDVGNSNIVLGGYRGRRPVFVARLATERRLEADQYAVQMKAVLALHGLQSEPVEGVALSSVVPGLTDRLLQALAHVSAGPVLQLSLAESCGVEVAIDNPRELGMDILASAIAVRAARPLPAVIVDMGTATKLTALDGEGRLLGVSIAPGLFLSLEALVSGTSQLQGIPLTPPAAAIGRNTADSMRSGLILGTASLLDGMIDRFDAELGGAQTLVATGGAAPLVVPHCRHQIEYSETLVLEGLVEAWHRARRE